MSDQYRIFGAELSPVDNALVAAGGGGGGSAAAAAAFLHRFVLLVKRRLS